MAQSRFLNPCQNAGNYRGWFEEHPMLRTFGLVRTRAKPFLVGAGNFEAPHLGRYATLYVEARAKESGVTDPNIKFSSMACEILTPLVPDAKLMDVRSSRMRVVGIAMFILSSPEKVAHLFRPEFAPRVKQECLSHLSGAETEWDAAPLDNDNAADRYTEQTWNAKLADDPNYVLPFEAANAMIWFLTTMMKPAHDLATIKMVVTVLVALAKQGTVSEHFINKIAEGIRSGLNIEIQLDSEEVRSVYQTFGRKLTADNARLLVRHLRGLIPDIALRVNLTLQQAAGSGLSTFMFITDMIKAFPNFKWEALIVIVPQEWAKLLEAVGVVNNIWFGYAQEKGAAAAKNFPTLFYISAQLAIKKLGVNSWKTNGGGRSGIREKGLCDALIAHFVTRQEGAPEEVPLDVWENEHAGFAEQQGRIVAVQLADPELSVEEQGRIAAMLASHVMPAVMPNYPDVNVLEDEYLGL